MLYQCSIKPSPFAPLQLINFITMFIVFIRSFDLSLTFFDFQFFGNRAKGRISKQVLQENKARQIFRKTNISYPLISRTLFSCNTRFDIRLCDSVDYSITVWIGGFSKHNVSKCFKIRVRAEHVARECKNTATLSIAQT